MLWLRLLPHEITIFYKILHKHNPPTKKIFMFMDYDLIQVKIRGHGQIGLAKELAYSLAPRIIYYTRAHRIEEVIL